MIGQFKRKNSVDVLAIKVQDLKSCCVKCGSSYQESRLQMDICDYVPRAVTATSDVWTKIKSSKKIVSGSF